MWEGYWTVQDVQRHASDKIFVFADNLKRYGKIGQAIIRDCPNAFGIATKNAPGMNALDFWSDTYLSHNKARIDNDFAQLRLLLQRHPSYAVVFPKFGLGTDLSYLAHKAPQTNQYLQLKMQSFIRDIGSLHFLA